MWSMRPLVKCSVWEAVSQGVQHHSQTSPDAVWHRWMTGWFIWESFWMGPTHKLALIASMMMHFTLTHFWVCAILVAVCQAAQFATMAHRQQRKRPSWLWDGWIISTNLSSDFPQRLPWKYPIHTFLCLWLTWRGKSLTAFVWMAAYFLLEWLGQTNTLQLQVVNTHNHLQA